jgi:hypothetical protein
MIILMSIEQITSLYRSVLLPGVITDSKSLVLSGMASNEVGEKFSESFFILQKKNRQLEAEIERLRTELEGKVFKVGSRVVATGDSAWNHYKQGSTGIVVKVDKEDGDRLFDPLVRWDHSGETLQTSKLKISAYEELKTCDGTILDYHAVGLKVTAQKDSAWGHYKKGDQGVIVRLNPTDPVVRWEKSGTELQTSRHKLKSAVVVEDKK